MRTKQGKEAPAWGPAATRASSAAVARQASTDANRLSFTSSPNVLTSSISHLHQERMAQHASFSHIYPHASVPWWLLLLPWQLGSRHSCERLADFPRVAEHPPEQQGALQPEGAGAQRAANAAVSRPDRRRRTPQQSAEPARRRRVLWWACAAASLPLAASHVGCVKRRQQHWQHAAQPKACKRQACVAQGFFACKVWGGRWTGHRVHWPPGQHTRQAAQPSPAVTPPLVQHTTLQRGICAHLPLGRQPC